MDRIDRGDEAIDERRLDGILDEGEAVLLDARDVLVDGRHALHDSPGRQPPTRRPGARDTFDAIVTDPPYSSGGFVRGDRMCSARSKYVTNGAQHGLADFDGDNRDQRGYLAWCTVWLGEAHRIVRSGAPIAPFTDWRQLPTTTDAIQAGGFVWRGIAPWTKNNASRPAIGRYRNDAEYLVWGSRGPMLSRREVGCLPGTFVSPPVHHTARKHNTEKPIAVMEQIVAICPPGGTVFDPFAGSGSTGVAAIRSGRRFVGVEKSAAIFDVACERLRAA